MLFLMRRFKRQTTAAAKKNAQQPAAIRKSQRIPQKITAHVRAHSPLARLKAREAMSLRLID
jgi:hypothetical protein